MRGNGLHISQIPRNYGVGMDDTDLPGAPEGYGTLTPHLMIDGAAQAIEVYRKAFGAEVLGVMPMPDSDEIMHARLRIKEANLFLSDPAHWDRRKPPKGEPCSAALYLYVEDCDAWYTAALAAGMTTITEPEDMFYGDRIARVADPFGYDWTIATHVAPPT